MSFLKKIKTAANDPMCKLTSIDKLLFSNSKYSETNIRCDEELIGKNSATP